MMLEFSGLNLLKFWKDAGQIQKAWLGVTGVTPNGGKGVAKNEFFT